MAKTDSTHPWQQIEEQAFHAFREWHLWLVLRERELAPPIPVTRGNKDNSAKFSEAVAKRYGD